MKVVCKNFILKNGAEVSKSSGFKELATKDSCLFMEIIKEHMQKIIYLTGESK